MPATPRWNRVILKVSGEAFSRTTGRAVDEVGVRSLAESIAGRNMSGSALPADLDLFPQTDLVPDSFELVPRGVLGLRGLSRALSARYECDDNKMTLYLVRENDPESAEKAIAGVSKSLDKHSTQPVENVTIAGREGIRAELRYHGTVLVLRSDENIVLITGMDDMDGVDAITSALLRNLTASKQ